ncbi:hypothetical protein LNQ03_08545 [Klebsiella pneumoniae subsp. pneumoniae]|nr:hypothetical protein [Klebsiella pneumoniae subsp. pneumoniae]
MMTAVAYSLRTGAAGVTAIGFVLGSLFRLCRRLFSPAASLTVRPRVLSRCFGGVSIAALLAGDAAGDPLRRQEFALPPATGGGPVK